MRFQNRILLLLMLGAWVSESRAARDDDVAVSVLGADGEKMTQVASAQLYGLNGYGIRVCVMDNSIDIMHPTFGNCSAKPPWRWPCKVFYDYDASSPNQTAVPAPNVYHGTHVAGIAVGLQPYKLRDGAGNILPYQKGVAFQAFLGAFKIGDSGRSDATSNLFMEAIRRAWNETVKAQCDVINMSFGSLAVEPAEDDVKGFQPVIDKGIIPVAAAGNGGGNRGEALLWSVASPALIRQVISVAAVNNSEVPVTMFEIDRKLKVSDQQTTYLWSFNRVDTQATTRGTMQLPVSLLLMRTSPSFGRAAGCLPLVPITKMPDGQLKYKGVVLQIMPDCASRVETDPEMWDWLLALQPRLVLMVNPDDGFAFGGSVQLRNRQVPVFFMSALHGIALADRLAQDPSRSIRLMRMAGTFMMPLPREWGGQPTTFSSMGPSLDLGMKPDIAAPGTLMYSSVPKDRYQSLQGTSMASPYMAGVVALWKQRQRQLNITRPADGWITAAARALKNTARPIRYLNTTMMWPPLKIGAGLVRAMAAAYTDVVISPPELLLCTDVAVQTLEVTLTNSGPSDITYTVQHNPSVGVSITRAWYRQPYDVDAPSAIVVLQPAVVTVPGKGKATVKVVITLPDQLRRLDNIVSGFLTFTPGPNQPRSAPIPAVPPRQINPYEPMTPDMARLSPLSVPYQGTSKDYSSFGLPGSLALFAASMPELNAVAATMLLDRPPAYVCDTFQDDSTCMYTRGTVLYMVDMWELELNLNTIYLAVAMVRPAARVEVEVWCVPTARSNCTTPAQNSSAGEGSEDGGVVFGKQAGAHQPGGGSLGDGGREQQQGQVEKEFTVSIQQAAEPAGQDVFLGTSDLGAIPPSMPLSYSFLQFSGSYYINSNYTSDRVAPVLGTTYRYRLRITPPLALGDAAAGRKQANVYLVDVASTAAIVRRPPTGG